MQGNVELNRPRVVVTGLSFPAGFIVDESLVHVCSDEDTTVPAILQPTSRWPDGSLRWGLLKVLVQPAQCDLRLYPEHHASVSPAGLKVKDHEVIEVTDGELNYAFAAGEVFPKISLGAVELVPEATTLVVTDEADAELDVRIDSPELIAHDELSVRIGVNGVVHTGPNRQLNLRCLYDIYGSGDIEMICEVHNPHRAMHPEGIWDLGDAGSTFINSMSLNLAGVAQKKVQCRLEKGGAWLQHETAAEFTLHQASSGGEHWDCPTHVNRHNQCTNEFSGYRYTAWTTQPVEGSRASPSLIMESAQKASISITPVEFWQNFPKRLTCKNDQITIDLFPRVANDSHEIQGGERKQHRICFSMSTSADELKHTVDTMSGVSPSVVGKHHFICGNILGSPNGEHNNDYDKLLQFSLDSAAGFFAKRESQDEFGWRHFGDVVADHETLYHDDGSYFISHYNNQYDCIYGFARQFLLSGDARWYQLMDELARHVLDIDIYRTDEDRAEYNHGLFWHTDHYLKASTATHRTYSRDHYPEGWSGPKGGGPGPEHCYTSGLKIYYYLSGNVDARDAVVRMAQWITSYYEGSGTLIEYGKSLITHDLKKFISTVKGQQVLRYRYPFNRGVGNYIRALLDSYELTEDSDYLQRAARVIADTFGADDDISMRNLEDIEGTWYYTVFLQEVIRFLDVKRLAGQFDDKFYHALDGLLHYARWMAENEQPYLLQPDRLEYPNDTWVAQDIRKANVLYGAYLYAGKERDVLLERARYFRDYVTQTLSRSETLHFARIQALLMQNHGPASAMDQPCSAHSVPARTEDTGQSTCVSVYQSMDLIRSVAAGFIKAVKTTSPRREYTWVRARLGK